MDVLELNLHAFPEHLTTMTLLAKLSGKMMGDPGPK
jgi:hypothetical protein